MATTNLAKPTSFDRTLASARSHHDVQRGGQAGGRQLPRQQNSVSADHVGYVIGSASIILVATLGSTGKQYALDQLTSIGPNKIELQYSGGTVSGPDNTSTPDYMTLDDMHAVLDQVPGIVASSPMLEFHANVSVGGGGQQSDHAAWRLSAVSGRTQPHCRLRPLLRRPGRAGPRQGCRHRQAVRRRTLWHLARGSRQDYQRLKAYHFKSSASFAKASTPTGQSEISEHTIAHPLSRGSLLQQEHRR